MSQLNFFFGLGIFLLGMYQVETGIRQLSDARLRQWLRESTGTTFGSVSTGVVTTAILQSSSLVSLLVLAFASAQLLPLANAIGIILGANLGSTVAGWLVAIFGFKFDLETMSLPLLGIAGFLLARSKRESRLANIALVALGIGLLLFGLGIMKTSMETIPEGMNVAALQGLHPVVYLLFGMGVTFLVQSSSAVVMMGLAAVNSGIIMLPEAAALVIGADIGTTSTAVLGSLNGSIIKKQLAFAHVAFNLIVDLAAFFLLLPLLPLLLTLLRISDPLIGLVAFHSTMNLLGLLAFIPIIKQYTRGIEKLFAHWSDQPKSLLDRVPSKVVDAALVALADTVRSIVLQAICNAMRAFSLQPEKFDSINAAIQKTADSIEHLNFEQGYEYLKTQEGEVLRYSLKIQAEPLAAPEAIEIERLQAIARAVIYCNKTLKDIQLDLRELEFSGIKGVTDLYLMQKEFQKNVYQKLVDLLLGEHSVEFMLEELDELKGYNEKHFDEVNRHVHSEAGVATGDGTLISVQLNVNREVRLACRSMLQSMKRLIMDQSIAGYSEVG